MTVLGLQEQDNFGIDIRKISLIRICEIAEYAREGEYATSILAKKTFQQMCSFYMTTAGLVSFQTWECFITTHLSDCFLISFKNFYFLLIFFHSPVFQTTLSIVFLNAMSQSECNTPKAV